MGEVCCDVFRDKLENAGRRALSVVISEGFGRPFATLQSRGVDHASLEQKSKIKIPNQMLAEGADDVVINLMHSAGISYCPWCGTKLSRQLRKYEVFYRELAERHRTFDYEPATSRK